MESGYSKLTIRCFPDFSLIRSSFSLPFVENDNFSWTNQILHRNLFSLFLFRLFAIIVILDRLTFILNVHNRQKSRICYELITKTLRGWRYCLHVDIHLSSLFVTSFRSEIISSHWLLLLLLSNGLVHNYQAYLKKYLLWIKKPKNSTVTFLTDYSEVYD